MEVEVLMMMMMAMGVVLTSWGAAVLFAGHDGPAALLVAFQLKGWKGGIVLCETGLQSWGRG